MKTISLLACLCVLPSIVCAEMSPPAGWRFPTDADCTGSWKEFRGGRTAPFHIRADFNGDGIDDDVWILFATKSNGWGLFLFEARKSGFRSVVELDITDPGKDPGGGQAQNMGVEIAAAGDYRTACGKGYWACAKGEPKVLHMVRPGINYFQFESASSIFWWDDKSRSFKRTWISD